MRVHVGDPAVVPKLLRHFEEQANCVAVQVGETEIEVSLLGSFRSEAHDAEIESLLAEFSRRRLGPACGRPLDPSSLP